VCAVASRHEETALACAADLNCETYTDDYRDLKYSGADALLIEVPHRAQEEIVLWGLDEGYPLLIGGALAPSVQAGRRIVEAAARHRQVVEAGFQRRYNPAWEEMRRLIQDRELGDPLMAVCMALWDATPGSWYYDQELSGGMPLTHMSYCSLNAIRWLLGRPVSVSAAANRIVETAPGRVDEETCGALVTFESGAIASATASYVAPEGMPDARTRFLCSRGGIVENADADPETVSITVYGEGQEHVRSFASDPPSMVRQANTFLDALEGEGEIRNPPEDALVDCQIAEAISRSARERIVVSLDA
jgi:myo-inositol 2-dehydrogenase/D-chiro-inositol 1-dehydrogenase/scyllo-inositol 2-dehydrogenase (NAD+)